MVHMDKVEVYGFKSFGFKNTVLKMSPGLVSISGPNGSGKSSILDAIVFALGEKSPKILRVPSMKSVVNDQEGSRSSTRMARASVHLDNTDRKIPVDSDRVVVTRIIDEGGESTYYLNKQKTTRSRIRNMLDVANAAPNPFNHVQQGYIQRISELGTDERQKTIEDLVGLSYFDEKKKEATSQLDRADRRLEVALAKMDEVKNRILEMEEERNQVIRDKILKDELKHYTTIQLLQKLERLRDKIKNTTERSETLHSDIENATTTRQQIQEEIQSIISQKQTHMDNADEYGKNRTDIAAAVAEAVQGVQNITTNLKITESRISDNNKNLSDTRRRIHDTISYRYKIRQDTKTTHEDMTSVSKQLHTISETLRTINKHRATVLKWQSDVASKKARSENVLKLYRATLSTHEKQLYNITNTLSGNIQKIKSDKTKLAKLKQSLSDMISAQKSLKHWVEQSDSKINDMSNKLNTSHKTRAKLKQDIADMDKLTSSADKITDRYDSKLHLARRVMHEDYSVGRLRVDAPELGVRGIAYELLSWDPKYERAVMAVASDWLKALVVEDVNTMLSIAYTIQDMNLPRVRMIPLHSIPDVSSSGNNTLSKHVRCSDDFAPLRNFLFGDVVLCDSLSAARRIAKNGKRAVTIQGQCVGFGDSLILDRGSAVANLSKMISVSADIEDLQRSIKNLKKLRTSYVKKMARIDDKISKYGKKISGMRESKAAADQSLSDLDSRITTTKSIIHDISVRLQKYQSEIPNQEAESHRLSVLVDRVKEMILSEEEQIPSGVTQKIATKLELLNNQKTEFETLKTNADTKYSKILAKWETTQSHNTTLIRDGVSLAKKQITLIHEGKKLRESLGPLQETLSKKNQIAESLRQREQKIIQMSSDFTKQIKECDDALEPLRGREKQLTGTIADLRRQQDAIRRDLVDYQEKSSQITEKLPFNVIREKHADIDPQPFIDKIRTELENMPPLNANAPTSYATVSSGYRSMSERKNKLEMERNKIVAFIEGVEKDKRQTYLDAFDIVDTEIRSIFSKMSGGNAWLELEDEDDIFASGIRYMVQFPEKQKRVSTSLSGGEKTLAAIVFVLALQKLKPSPFYLFDEADAHLDATNAERLANILSERSQNSQFIMVSLKEFVVKKASLIYGVYPKNGISQVVSYPDNRARPVSI